MLRWCFDGVHSMIKVKKGATPNVPSAEEPPPTWDACARAIDGSNMSSSGVVAMDGFVGCGSNLTAKQCRRMRVAQDEMTSSFGKGGVVRRRSRSRVLCTSSRKPWTIQS